MLDISLVLGYNKLMYEFKNITQKQAIALLMDKGVLTKFNESNERFHGRVSDGKDQFYIDPNFNNGGDSTGNRNLNTVATLYTGTQDIAEEFSEARARQQSRKGAKNIQKERHEISSYVPNALIFDTIKARKFSAEEQEEIRQLLKLAFCDMKAEYIDIKFEDRDLFLDALNQVRRFEANHKFDCVINKTEEIYSMQDLQDFEKYCAERKIAQNVYNYALEYIKMNNTRILFPYNAVRLCQGYLQNTNFVIMDLGAKQNVKVPFSPNTIAKMLSDNNVIAFRQSVDSATIDKIIDILSIFDLEKINTQKEIANRMVRLEKYYSPIMNVLSGLSQKLENKSLGGADVEAVVKAFKKHTSPEIAKSLNQSAHVWEGFSVLEHTETVMNVYQNSYSLNNTVNPEMLPLMNSIILLHDLGKGDAYIKENQEKCIRDKTKLACSQLGLSQKEYNLLSSITLNLTKYTADYYVNKNAQALINLRVATESVLKDYLDRKPTMSEVLGLEGICRMLQTCDSAAFTKYAKTKDYKRNITYQNGNDRFTSGMEKMGDQIRFQKDAKHIVFGFDHGKIR